MRTYVILRTYVTKISMELPTKEIKAREILFFMLKIIYIRSS